MADPQKVAFTVHPSPPLTITISSNGIEYVSTIRLAIIEVIDTGKFHPLKPDIPIFEFKAQMLAETTSAGDKVEKP